MFITADISNISRGSLHDGEGVRTVVYFKGCGMRCRWCHNPETFRNEKEILFNPQKCIRCGECIDVCPEHHRIVQGESEFLRDGCTKCGKCAELCPNGALWVCGEKMTVEQVYDEIVKDRHYYEESGGGITLSGGECLLQADFAAELLKRCKKENINTAIESAFFVPYEKVKKVLPYLDFVYADLKIPDSAKHKKYTGQGNELIIENIRRLSNEFDNIVIRIPLIPGVNDSVEDMEKFSEIIRSFGSGIKGVELLRYNYLAESKYASLGMRYESFGKEAQSEEQITKLYKKLKMEEILLKYLCR